MTTRFNSKQEKMAKSQTKMFGKNDNEGENETGGVPVRPSTVPRRLQIGDTNAIQEETNSHGPEATPKESVHTTDEFNGWGWDEQVPETGNPQVFGENVRHKWMLISGSNEQRLRRNSSPSSLAVEAKKRSTTWQCMLAQALVPIFLAGCGLIFAGYYLLMLQVQAVLAGICSGIFAMFLVWVRAGTPQRHGNSDLWILLAVSCSAACITCFVICLLTMMSTIICFKYHIDPNHVAVSIVAAIGDISTLGLLDANARVLHRYEEMYWLAPLVTIGILVVALFLTYVAYCHPFTRSALWACWFPILLVVILSCFAGMLLEFEGKEFDNMELYQPLITGIGGTIVAIHYATISSDYFRNCKPGNLPGLHGGCDTSNVCDVPRAIWCPRRKYTAKYLIVLGVVVPAQALFSLLIWGVIPNHTKECYGLFFSLYVLSCLVQSAILLYSTHVLLNLLWKLKIDPGFYVIPCLHGFGDILGTLFLLMCCQTYKIKSCSSET